MIWSAFYLVFRVRQSVECAFGILCKRFRIFQHTMEYDQQMCARLVHVGIILHNFLINRGDVDDDFQPEGNGLVRLRLHRNTHRQIAKIYRTKFVDYFAAQL